MRRRRVLGLLGALAVIVLTLAASVPSARADTLDSSKIDPALQNLMTGDPLRLLPVIVEMQAPGPPMLGPKNVTRAAAALDLLRLNGVAVGQLALIDGAAGFANSAGISAISLSPTVAYIYYDATIGPHNTSAPAPPAPLPSADQLAAVYPRVVNADKDWAQAITGNSVTVAVLDSGIAPDADLVSPTNRIIASVNFADQRVSPDPGGHGTHIAGIIAGNGTNSAGQFVGIAPQANLVDVRVLDSRGSGRISSVVRGIEWVLANRATYNIRVINLSFGAPATTSYRTDPMATAIEIAWRRGLVVVAAAGNTGPSANTVVTPGTDPYAITVGATDDQGTLTPGDDTLAWFSAWGTADSNVKPDVVAPGRRIVSIRVPGSALDTLFPDHVVVAQNGATYMRLSGTSQATAVVSGEAALLLQGRPTLYPDQVKALVMGTATAFGQQSGSALPAPTAAGNGLIDAWGAMTAQPPGYTGPAPLLSAEPSVTVTVAPVNRGLRPANGFARALYPVLYATLVQWLNSLTQLSGSTSASSSTTSTDLSGSTSPTASTTTSTVSDPSTWTSVAWDSVAWDSVAWDSVAWDSVAWDSVAWDSVAWDSVAWDSVAWDSVAWDSFNLD